MPPKKRKSKKLIKKLQGPSESFVRKLIKYGVPVATIGTLGYLGYKYRNDKDAAAYASQLENLDEIADTLLLRKIDKDEQEARMRDAGNLILEELKKMEQEKEIENSERSEYSQSELGINASEDSGFKTETDEDEIEEKPGFVKRLVSLFDKKGKKEAEESIDLPMPGSKKARLAKLHVETKKKRAKGLGSMLGDLRQQKKIKRKPSMKLTNGKIFADKQSMKSKRKSPLVEAEEILQKRPSLKFPYSISNKIYDATANTIKYGGPLALGAVGIVGRKKVKRAAVDVYNKLKELSGYYLTDDSPDFPDIQIGPHGPN